MKNTKKFAEGAEIAACQVPLPLSRMTIGVVADLIRGHLKKIGSRWCMLDPGRRRSSCSSVCATTGGLSDLAGGDGVSALHRPAPGAGGDRSARCPYSAPGPVAGENRPVGWGVRPRRRKARSYPKTHRNVDRRNYFGTHKVHGLPFLGITDAAGNLLWISAATPGRVSDLTAAHRNHISARLRAADLGAICDLGFTALDDDPGNPVITTGKRAACKRPLTKAQGDANMLVSRERAASEHGFAELKNRRVLAKTRMNARHAPTCFGHCSS